MISKNKNNKNVLGILKKQHYFIVGKNKHSAVQICRWIKKSLLDEDFCFKQKFYGIKSHLCCQMTPCIACTNECVHCWRAVELNKYIDIDLKNTDDPKEIIKGCIEAQRKLLYGFKSNKKINMKKFEEAQEPMHFAISLIGEPTIYPQLGGLMKELRRQKKTSFLVTNGLFPEKLMGLEKNKALPTQLCISLNTPNKELYDKWHKSKIKNAWEKFNKSLEIMSKLKKKTRTVIRMNIVRDLNMKDEYIKEYAKLIKKASPMFIGVKGYMSVGFARKRLGYEKMPFHSEIVDFAKKIKEELNKVDKSAKKYKILDEKIESRVVLLGRDRRKMKIKKSEL